MAREIFYHDCPPAIVDHALGHLRPQAATPIVETSPLRRRGGHSGFFSRPRALAELLDELTR